MIVIVFSGFVVAFILLLAGSRLKGKLFYLASLLPINLFIYLLSLLNEIPGGKSIFYKYPWVPSLGLNLEFRLDGLSMLFSLLITGIGSLVFLYATNYLQGHKYLGRFFCYLSIFMASMLGLVLSENVLLMFIFWELTSISSFFLIGFNNTEHASRKSAMIALCVTGGGGFLLMAGFIFLGYIAHSYSIAEMMHYSSAIKENPLFGLIILFIFSGVFTKSAQFPFHFWLPEAMKAPTPVSAYLHSATMVKAGIYLLLRFSPVLGDNILWNNTLMIFGGITMLYAAFHSIFRIDMKNILAYSTISALGVITFLIGIGTSTAILAAIVFILVHAFYKASLFLITGLIDHETGTRDITKLSGLRMVMMPAAIAGLLAAISSAGIPFTFGFIGKDLIYEATLNTDFNSILLTSVAVITNILLLCAGFLAGIKPFIGKLPEKLAPDHAPPFILWFTPLVLSILGLIFGMFPAIADNLLINPVVSAVMREAKYDPLKIWHGFNFVLVLSGITLVVGFLLFYLLKPSKKMLDKFSRFEGISPSSIFLKIWAALRNFSALYSRTFQNGFLRSYLISIILFLVVLLSYKLFTGVDLYIDYSYLSNLTVYEVVVFLITILSIFKAITTASRLIAVVCMSILGYCICLFYVFYSAPDLAMTQFTIDTLTVVLFVLVLLRLPPFVNIHNPMIKVRDALISTAFGALIAITALQVLNEPVNKEISNFYAEHAYVTAKGKNIVNVILVDFRGIDTLIEITVLTIAALGVYTLLKLKIKTSEIE